MEPVDLNATIADVVGDLRALVQEADADIYVAKLPVVLGDAMQLRVLFQNLIENAIKFRNHKDSVKVRIVAIQEPDVKKCKITVSDNGIGIEPVHHEKIFTIFKRLNAEQAFEGSGLGLAICRRIAANHGGKITVTSEPYKGSSFSIGLDCT